MSTPVTIPQKENLIREIFERALIPFVEELYENPNFSSYLKLVDRPTLLYIFLRGFMQGAKIERVNLYDLAQYTSDQLLKFGNKEAREGLSPKEFYNFRMASEVLRVLDEAIESTQKIENIKI